MKILLSYFLFLLPFLIGTHFVGNDGPEVNNNLFQNHLNVIADTSDYKLFTLDELRNLHSEQGRLYYRFIHESSISAGLYRIEKDGNDPQSPHNLDEVYVITQGEGILSVGNDEYEAGPGSIIYVKANVPHRFHNISDDLEVLVFFPRLTPDPSAPDWVAMELESLLEEYNSQKNVWNKFLDVPTMQMGLYLLPESVGGDSTLTHDIDEINIVMKGNAEFMVNEENIPVSPGSIIYVKKDTGHHFHSLEGDFEVLILFLKNGKKPE